MSNTEKRIPFDPRRLPEDLMAGQTEREYPRAAGFLLGVLQQIASGEVKQPDLFALAALADAHEIYPLALEALKGSKAEQ
jgi:hypothetical protein